MERFLFILKNSESLAVKNQQFIKKFKVTFLTDRGLYIIENVVSANSWPKSEARSCGPYTHRSLPKKALRKLIGESNILVHIKFFFCWFLLRK